MTSICQPQRWRKFQGKSWESPNPYRTYTKMWKSHQSGGCGKAVEMARDVDDVASFWKTLRSLWNTNAVLNVLSFARTSVFFFLIPSKHSWSIAWIPCVNNKFRTMALGVDQRFEMVGLFHGSEHNTWNDSGPFLNPPSSVCKWGSRLFIFVQSVSSLSSLFNSSDFDLLTKQATVSSSFCREILRRSVWGRSKHEQPMRKQQDPTTLLLMWSCSKPIMLLTDHSLECHHPSWKKSEQGTQENSLDNDLPWLQMGFYETSVPMCTPKSNGLTLNCPTIVVKLHVFFCFRCFGESHMFGQSQISGRWSIPWYSPDIPQTYPLFIDSVLIFPG